MVVRRLRKTLKRSLSIAMAAALMVTSVPELSVTAAEQETVSEQDISEETAPAETEEGAPQDGSTAEGISTEITSAEQKEDTAETQESSTEQHETKSVSETESASDTQSMTEREDSIESETETAQQTETEEETTESEAEAETEERIDREEEAAQGTIIFEDDFESKNEGDKSDEQDKSGTVVKIGDNQVMEYTVALQGTSWEQAFATSYALPQAYETPVKEKLTMEFDIYIPDSAENSETRTVADFGTMKLQLVLNNGPDWTWLASDSYPEIKADSFTASDIDGYSKKHVSVDITGNKETDKEWDFTDLTSLRAVTIKAVGDTSTYQGKLYIDNVVLKDTSTKTEPSEPEEPEEPATSANEEVFYEENFNDISDIASLVNMEGSTLPKDASGNVLASVEVLSTGNKAIKIPVDLSKTTEWTDIFKVQIDLPSEYAKQISEKVVMSYDLYFPEGSVGADFNTMTVMPGLKSGKDQTWVTVKNGRNYATENWAETDIEGYKVFHVEVDMNEFTTWDGEKNVDYAFSDITPVKSVIPCLAGNTSKYKGHIYLDNLKVKAVGVTADDGNTGEPDNPQDPDNPGEAEKPLEGELVYKQDFNELSSLENVLIENVSGRTPELAELAAGNKAVKYTVGALAGGSWDDIFKAELKLAAPYEETITDKVIMSYDVYFPEESVAGGEGGTFDSIKAQAALKSGADGTWVSQKSWPEFKAETLVEDTNVPGFKKAHIVIDMDNFETWNGSANEAYPFEQITPIQAVIPCLAGSGSTYAGDIYLDNIEVRAVSSDEPNPPSEVKELIYENDFNTLESLENVLTENVEGRTPQLAELVTGNKAVKYTVSALAGGSWDDIFKAQFNLPAPYDKQITKKVVMSYDIYFPSASVAAESFDMMKAQATVASGSAWDWATQKTWPEIKIDTLEDDANVPDFKKAHIEIDMDNLQVWDGELNDNKPYPFDKITPIQAVIPCLAGSGSKYSGELYLDNLKVWAVNETTETPDPTEDVVLTLDASAWTVGDKYQYNGESKIENKTIGDKKFLAVTVDYAQDAATGWSEAKFNYAHPEQVPSLKGYNAFVADVYYKPANKTAGSFAMKLFAK